jgi:hypothetical protein
VKIIKYEINKNILTVGFNEDNFVVYSSIAYDPNKTKQELLQQAYIQCKDAIEYEKTQDEPSILWNSGGDEEYEEYEEFTPEEPKANKLVVDFNNLTGEVLDQYCELYSTEVTFYIEGTDKAKIENNTVVESEVETDTEYFIAAKYNELVEKQKRIIYAPIIVDEPVDDEKIAMAEAIVDLNNRIQKLEGVK